MNVQWSPPEAPQKLKLSVDELFAMHEAGVFDHRHGIELLGGELFEMAAKNIRHETARQSVLKALIGQLPEQFAFMPEFGFRLSDADYVEPDFVVYPAACPLEDLSASTTTLVLEIAVSSLHTDLGLKAALYARHGIKDYWVYDVMGRKIVRHQMPADDAYQQIDEIALPSELPLSQAPGVTLSLS